MTVACIARVLRVATLLVGAFTVAPLAAQDRAAPAPVRVERGWPLAADGLVKIHNYVGRVRLIGWDRDSVHVSGTVAAHLSIFGGGTRAGIKLGPDGGQREARDVADLIVRVPAGANVSVRGAATDIEAEGLVTAADLSTVGGRITVRGAPQSLVAEAMDGSVTVSGTPSVFRARTATGAIVFDGAALDLALRTVSGAIDVRGGPVGTARLESIAGDVQFHATVQREGQITIETHGGDIEAVVPKESLSRVTARSFRGTARVRPR